MPILALVLLITGVDSQIGQRCGQSFNFSSLPSVPSEVPGAGDSVWRFDVVTCSMVDALMPRDLDLAVVWYLARPHTRATLVNTETHLSRKRERCSSDFLRRPTPAPRHPTSLRCFSGGIPDPRVMNLGCTRASCDAQHKSQPAAGNKSMDFQHAGDATRRRRGMLNVYCEFPDEYSTSIESAFPTAPVICRTSCGAGWPGEISAPTALRRAFHRFGPMELSENSLGGSALTPSGGPSPGMR